MDPLRNRPRGVLIVEAVVAAFLMIFAFAASTSLFHAALQWESQGANVRRAALLAEKKMAEIRAWSQDYHATASFDDGWVAPVVGIQPPYPEAPGFEIEVLADLPTCTENLQTGLTPLPGVYSPTSNFWDTPVAAPALPADFVNPQKNPRYATFASVRDFPQSFRRVQVIVRYGNEGAREYRAVTLVGDPITVGDPTISFTRIGGPANVSPGNPSDYRVNVSVAGHPIDDMVCLWGVDPLSTGAVIVKPTDANGREARVLRPLFGNPGTTRLAVRLRYRGREYTQFSSPINVL